MVILDFLSHYGFNLPNLLFCFFGYFVGSIPFGLIVTKLFGYGDIREIGSGNIGTTNVLRTGNKFLAIMTLILDAGKGWLYIYLFFLGGFVTRLCNNWGCDIFAHETYPHLIIITAGFFIILGHCFPIWLKFKGGKGVATALGALLAAVPFAGLAAAGAWIVTAFLFKISSLAALVAIGIAPIVTFFVYGAAPACVCLLITLLVWFRHKDNIKRLIRGEEPKIGAT